MPGLARAVLRQFLASALRLLGCCFQLKLRMTLRRTVWIALVFFLPALPAFAQNWISVGVKGGVPLTDAFADRTFNFTAATIPNLFGPPTIEEETIRTYSGSKNLLIGPTLELQLPLGLSVETDALYRRLSVNILETTSLLGFENFLLDTVPLSSRINSWEFPILAKYRLPFPVVKPYLEAGPSFRVAEKYMSSSGITAGIGIEAKLWRFRIAPEIRFTHWGRDGSNYPPVYHAVSYPNQVELLAGIATAGGAGKTASRTGRGFSERISFGVKGGVPFMTAFIMDSFGKVTFPSTPCSPVGCLTSTVQEFRASRNYLIGPTVELHLPLDLSMEADGLYHPLSLASLGFAAGIPALNLSPPSIKTYSSWEFPIVGKYKFRAPFARPYLEAGPAFRAVSSPLNQYPSSSGITAGVGVEAKLWKMRIAPDVRFVHWGKDSGNAYPSYASRRNQAEFLVGLSY